ncbi:MAG: PKD domain-containing protein [Flavipsychrobacter sp.]
MKARIAILLPLFLACFFTPAKATHIVGGEVTYKCLGNNWYEFTLTIYEDCLTGLPSAIAGDDPAFVNIFDGKGNPVLRDANGFLMNFDTIRLASRILVPTNFSNACVTNPPATCLNKATFVKRYYLPPNGTGYTFVYQRCCRNRSVQNIVNPAAIGATYSCTIPDSTIKCNNSAVFKNYPPQIICINNPLIYDHSATDPDGDSLSYEFCTDYSGGEDSSNGPTIPAPPPFLPVVYKMPYTYRNPMAGYPQIQIDARTGLITGKPNIIGRFAVTVCCHEWRNNRIINTVSREFQFVVTNCTKAVVADIPQYSTEPNTYIVDCADYTVHYVNLSKGGFSYYWDFGDKSTLKDTSTAFEPTYVYPDTGIYMVKLIVNKNTTCSDSISRIVKIYPVFRALFDYDGLQCPGSVITFTDKTSSTYKPIDFWQWNFGDGDTTSVENPVHTYEVGGDYKVVLISKNTKGCTDTMLKQIQIDKFKPFAGDDTTIVKGEHIQFEPQGGTQYIWSPSTNLDDPIGSPIGYYPDTGRFQYNVHVISAYGCEGDASIRVWVVDHGSYFIPSAFSPNGDGKNDDFRPLSVGYRKVNYFRVFNRWGQQVFRSNDFSRGWDGTFDGKRADIGTYFWVLSLQDRYGKEVNLKGDVTLLR